MSHPSWKINASYDSVIWIIIFLFDICIKSIVSVIRPQCRIFATWID